MSWFPDPLLQKMAIVRERILISRTNGRGWFFFWLGVLVVSGMVSLAYSRLLSATGLIGSYYPNSSWTGPPIYTTKDPVPDLQRMRGNAGDLSTDYSILWTGTIRIPDTGEYEFLLTSDDGAELFIDDELIVDNSGQHGSLERTRRLYLPKKLYPITIRYMQVGGTAEFKLDWKRPGSDQEPLPSRFLAPFGLRKAGIFFLGQRILAVLSLGGRVLGFVCKLCLLCLLLILLRRMLRSRQIFRAVNFDFILLIGFLLLLNIPYFVSAFRFLPAHDSMMHVLNFASIYKEYFFQGDLLSWMPYRLYGSSFDIFFISAMAPPFYLVMLLGKLTGITDSLWLFKTAVLLEQLVVLVGIYLLTKRIFVRRATMLFVSAGVLAVSAFWGIQITLNFRLYCIVPLLLYLIVRFYDTGSWEYLSSAGLLIMFYYVAGCGLAATVFSTFFTITFGGGLYLFHAKTLYKRMKSFWKLPSLCLAFCLVVLTASALHFSLSTFYHSVLYTPARDPFTGKINLSTFLTYGSHITPNNLLEFIYAVPSSGDQTLYIGIVPLVFLFYALLIPSQRPIFKVLTISTGLFGLFTLSYFSFVAPLSYSILPVFSYIRHLGLMRAPLKIFLLLLAGFGIDHYLDPSKQKELPRRSAWWIGIFMILSIIFFDAVAFQGKLPYIPRDKIAPEFYQFHFLTIGILGLLLFGMYRSERIGNRTIQRLVPICFIVEITSYHYCLLFSSPVTIPEPEKRPYQTIREYVKTHHVQNESLLVKDSVFQAQRMPPEQVAQTIEQTVPLLNQYWGVRYSNLYAAADIDPCLQEYRIDYVTLSIDRLMRARLGIPLDEPLVEGIPLPNVLSPVNGAPTSRGLAEDPVLMRAIGCQSPKLFLTSQVRVARDLDEAAEMIKTSQDFDTLPVLFSETDVPIELLQQKNVQPSSLGRLFVTAFSANTLNVNAQVTSPGGGWLMYLDAYHPGWRVTVNGQAREIVTANLAFKAVRLEAGMNEVAFRFTGNGWNKFYLQVFFVLGIVFTCALLGVTGWLCTRWGKVSVDACFIPAEDASAIP